MSMRDFNQGIVLGIFITLALLSIFSLTILENKDNEEKAESETLQVCLKTDCSILYDNTYIKTKVCDEWCKGFCFTREYAHETFEEIDKVNSKNNLSFLNETIVYIILEEDNMRFNFDIYNISWSPYSKESKIYVDVDEEDCEIYHYEWIKQKEALNE